MLPYFAQPSLQLGPVTIYTFGVFVAIGLIGTVSIALRGARQEGLALAIICRLLLSMLIWALVGTHLVHRFLHFPESTLQDPWSILRLSSGASSFGSFLGASAAAWLFLRRTPVDCDPWRYLDAIAYAFPFGWSFVRLGCFVAYDHPGTITDVFLGQRYIDGMVRHNLGLEEALLTIVIACIFYWLKWKPRPSGFFTGMLAVLYAPVRFCLDWLRMVDVSYIGLTPGQYGSLLLLGAGLLIFIRTQYSSAAAQWSAGWIRSHSSKT
jgi:phosphatidylglycerol---prolipoprotein diacylglyceryl transferase